MHTSDCSVFSMHIKIAYNILVCNKQLHLMSLVPHRCPCPHIHASTHTHMLHSEVLHVPQLTERSTTFTLTTWIRLHSLLLADRGNRTMSRRSPRLWSSSDSTAGKEHAPCVSQQTQVHTTRTHKLMQRLLLVASNAEATSSQRMSV